MEKLIRLGEADVNAVGGKCQTALTVAVHTGNTEVVDYLMEKGTTQKLAEIDNDAPYLFYPLHAAILQVRLELLPKPISAEPESVDLQDSQGRTALHIAMRPGSYDSVVELFSCGDRKILEVHAVPELYTKGHQGRTVLHHAVLSRNLELVQEVCLQWHMIDEKNKPFDVPDSDGWAALHWPCRVDDNEEAVAAFIDARGVSAVTEATNDGWTPEIICAFHSSGSTKTFIDEPISRLLD